MATTTTVPTTPTVDDPYTNYRKGLAGTTTNPLSRQDFTDFQTKANPVSVPNAKSDLNVSTLTKTENVVKEGVAPTPQNEQFIENGIRYERSPNGNVTKIGELTQAELSDPLTQGNFASNKAFNVTLRQQYPNLTDAELKARLRPETADELKTYNANKLATDQQATRDITGIQSAEAQYQQQKTQQQSAAVKSSIASSFAQDRNGFVSGANQMAQGALSKAVTQELESANRSFQIADIQRQDLVRRLDQAKVDGDQSTVEQIQKDLSRVETAVEESKARIAAADTQARKEALDIQNQASSAVTSTLTAFGADTLAKMPDTQIVSYVDSISKQYGLTSTQSASILGQATALKALSSQAALLKESDPDYQYKKAQLAKMQQDVISSGQTQAQKDIENYTQLKTALDAGQITKEYFDAKTGGIDAKEAAAIAKTNAETQKILKEISPSANLYSVDLKDVATGQPLPIGTLGNPSTVLRTDRHNNPTAAKAYPSAIESLKRAGLVQGTDFNLGETTQGVDTDGVATILYNDAASGVKGSVALLTDGQINSWYANPKYGGSTMIQSKIAALSGKDASTSANAQKAFNSLGYDDKVKVLESIYSHESGSRGTLFTKGTSSYSENQKNVMSGMDTSKKLTSTDLKVLSQNGLTSGDLYTFKSTATSQIPETEKQKVQDAVESIDGLLTKIDSDKGFTGAVGQSPEKFFSFLPGSKDGLVSGTEAVGFKADFDTLISRLALPNLGMLKGAMSDNDLKFIKSASAALNLDMDEASFKKTLQDLKAKYQKVTTPTTNLIVLDQSDPKYTTVLQTINKLQDQGASDDDIESTLIEMGYDPSAFIN